MSDFRPEAAEQIPEEITISEPSQPPLLNVVETTAEPREVTYSEREYGQITELANGSLYVRDYFRPIVIDHPLVVNIIQTPEFQQMFDKGHMGYREGHEVGLKMDPHTRGEHSIGVYAILTDKGASLKERLGGLLHDGGHPPFSHCMDYLWKSTHHQDTHDNRLQTVLERSEIPNLLDQHEWTTGEKITIDDILDEDAQPLREQSLPDLCADRIDYIGRDGFSAGLVDAGRVRAVLDGLTPVHNNGDRPMWVMANEDDARLYASLMEELNATYYTGPRSVAIHRSTVECLEHSIAQGYLQPDFYEHMTDSQVLATIDQYRDSDPQLTWLREHMDDPCREQTVLAPTNHSTVKHKDRVLDPLFFQGGQIVRLSDIDPEHAAKVADWYSRKENGNAYKVLHY